MEIILLGFNLPNTQAFAVLPYIAFFTGNTMRTVVLVSQFNLEEEGDCERAMTYHVLAVYSTA